LAWGLANRVVARGAALAEAEKLALQIAAFPQICMRNDRRSAYEQWGFAEPAAIDNEFRLGLATMSSGESVAGATRFGKGTGKHGSFD
jgi:enoyl-CoA hydratase